MSDKELVKVLSKEPRHEIEDRDQIALERMRGVDERLRELEPWLSDLKATEDGDYLAFRREFDPFQCTAVYVVPVPEEEPSPVHTCWRISCSAPGKKRFVWMIHRSALHQQMDGVHYYDEPGAMIDEIEAEIAEEIARVRQKAVKGDS